MWQLEIWLTWYVKYSLVSLILIPSYIIPLFSRECSGHGWWMIECFNWILLVHSVCYLFYSSGSAYSTWLMIIHLCMKQWLTGREGRISLVLITASNPGTQQRFHFDTHYSVSLFALCYPMSLSFNRLAFYFVYIYAAIKWWQDKELKSGSCWRWVWGWWRTQRNPLWFLQWSLQLKRVLDWMRHLWAVVPRQMREDNSSESRTDKALQVPWLQLQEKQQAIKPWSCWPPIADSADQPNNTLQVGRRC